MTYFKVHWSTVTRRAGDWAIAIIVPAAAVAVWWLLSADSTSVFFPPLSEILKEFQKLWLFDRFWSDVVPSMYRMLAGYGIAVIVGIAAGIMLGLHPLLRYAFNPAIEFGRGLSPAALVPISLSLFGFGDAPKIWLIAFVCLFPILLNTIDGVRSVPAGLDDVARSFRLSRRQRLLDIVLRSASPQIAAGMRIAIAIAFIMIIISEMFGATSGIGFATLQAQQSFQIKAMWTGMILLGVLGVMINTGFVLLERRALRWHYMQSKR